MSAAFSTNEFELSHSRKPRGRGSWAFDVCDLSPFKRDALLHARASCDFVRPERVNEETVRLWVIGSCTFAEARDRARRFLRPHFHAVAVTVCP